MTRYGPHDESTAPRTTTVGAGSNEPAAPIHPALVKQRQQLNQLAHNPAAVTKATVLAAVNDAADVGVAARIDAAILAVARRGGVFSANEVRPLVPDAPGPLMGARFNAAAKRGLISRVGYVASTKESTHGHPVAEWEAVA